MVDCIFWPVLLTDIVVEEHSSFLKRSLVPWLADPRQASLHATPPATTASRVRQCRRSWPLPLWCDCMWLPQQTLVDPHSHSNQKIVRGFANLNALSVISRLHQSPLLWGMDGRECIHVASRDGFGAVFLSILQDAPGQSLPVMSPVFSVNLILSAFISSQKWRHPDSQPPLGSLPDHCEYSREP